jgi:hypothetical protein
MHAAHENIGKVICSAAMEKLSDDELQCLAYMLRASETTVQSIAGNT